VFGKRGKTRFIKWFASGYILVIFMFAISVGLIFLLHVVGYFFPKFSHTCTHSGHFWNKVIAVIIPSLHFAYYFFRAWRNKRKLSPELTRQINEQMLKTEDFGKTLRDKLDVLGKIEKKGLKDQKLL
jgi:membrane protein implicated in regulation of membrane protease activity